MLKNYNILFVVFDKVDVNAGGVQNIVGALNNIFKHQGYTVKFLLHNNTVDDCEDIEYFSIYDNELRGVELNDRLLSFLQHNKFDFVINNHGLNYYTVLEKLKDYNKVLDVKFKLINYHHNAVIDIFHNYENITLNKFNQNKTKVNNIFLFLFKKIYFFKLFYLTLGKIKLWYSFKRATDYSDANVFHFDCFANETRNLFLSSKHKIYTHILPPIRYEFEPSGTNIKENIILYVGRIELMQKRFDKVLDIWKDCYQKLPNWKLVIVGDGDYLDNAKSFVTESKVLNVEFLGKANPLNYFKRSKIFVLTSDFEGLGLVLVEALTQACVPIAFNCYTGINNVIQHNFNGLVVPQGHDSEFKQTLLKLANNNQLLLDLQRNNQFIENNFLIENISQNWNDLFLKLKSE